MIVDVRPILGGELLARLERHLIGGHHVDHVRRHHSLSDALDHLAAVAREV